MKIFVRFFRQRNKSGFTLVEVVVSLALLAILMGGMILFISPIVRSFNDNKTDLTAENSAVCVQEYITKSIRNANQVAIFANTNYSDLSSNATYTAKIAKMNKFCTDVNAGAKDDKNKIYLLKCISLKYDSTDGRYYLYNETVKDNGELDTTAGKTQKVFSDCLFNDLYMTFELKKAKNGDYLVITGAPEYRDDTLDITICAYRDEDRKSLAFQGNGLSELRQIKVMLNAGGSKDDYNLSVYPDPAVLKSFADMDEGSRDIFIYYVVRQMNTSTT